MGVADSPLRDRVIFVQGAPRSGTTWMLMLLATHPQIAGVEAESHLFEFGVDRIFDNFENRHPHIRGLDRYLERPELLDLVRDLCDGVLMAMRGHIGRGSEPAFVVEKTPTSLAQASLDLRRKRECFPDAWYLHVVRDGGAVARSLMKAPWMHGRSEAECRSYWEDCVGTTREVLQDHPRYREISYEALREDPAEASREVFDWLGVDAGEETLEVVRRVSGERFAELGGAPAAASDRTSVVDRARRVATKAGGVLAQTRRPGSQPAGRRGEATPSVNLNFVRALRERDRESLAAMSVASLTVAYRSAEGDVVTSGDAALDVLVQVGEDLFARRHVGEVWSAGGGGPGETWTRPPGQPFWAVFFSALDGDATRVDVSFGLVAKEDRLEQVIVISAGPLAGRPLREALDARGSAGGHGARPSPAP